jgi:hypothetical protein
VLPASTGAVVKRPSAPVAISTGPAQMDAPRSGPPVAASSTRPLIGRASPRRTTGAAGAGASAAGVTASGVVAVSPAGVSGDGYSCRLASHDSAAAKRVVGNSVEGNRIVASTMAARSVRTTSDVQESERGAPLWSIRRSQIIPVRGFRGHTNCERAREL